MQSREWCLIQVDPASTRRVIAALADLRIEAVSPTVDGSNHGINGSAPPAEPVLSDILFVEHSDDLMTRIGTIDARVTPVLNNAGRIQVVPQRIVDALQAERDAPCGDGSLSQLRSRLLALSEFYRLDYLLSEVARLQSRGYHDAHHPRS